MGAHADRERNDLAAFCLWNSRHLLENRTRAAYAEWLVHHALQIPPSEYRQEGAPVELTDGRLTLEIRSAAYVQSWSHQQPTRISFATEQRTATAYVFCLLVETDPDKADPQDLSQWRFWVVLTRSLHPERKSIGLQALIRSFGEGLHFGELKAAVDRLSLLAPPAGLPSASLC